MNRAKANLILTMLTGLALLTTPLATKAWERGKVETFARLPPVRRIPRGSPRTVRATSMSPRWR